LSALHAREARYGRLRVVEYDGHVRAELPKQRAHNSFFLLEHSHQQVLGLDLLVSVPFSQFDRRLNRFLRS
jgi:hypothetical protein